MNAGRGCSRANRSRNTCSSARRWTRPPRPRARVRRRQCRASAGAGILQARARAFDGIVTQRNTDIGARTSLAPAPPAPRPAWPTAILPVPPRLGAVLGSASADHTGPHRATGSSRPPACVTQAVVAELCAAARRLIRARYRSSCKSKMPRAELLPGSHAQAPLHAHGRRQHAAHPGEHGAPPYDGLRWRCWMSSIACTCRASPRVVILAPRSSRFSEF